MFWGLDVDLIVSVHEFILLLLICDCLFLDILCSLSVMRQCLHIDNIRKMKFIPTKKKKNNKK